jgi:hypothetical protein
MHTTVLPPLAAEPRTRPRVVMLVILSVCVGSLLVSLGVVGVGAVTRGGPFVPTAAEGLIAEDASATTEDAHLPAIAQLDSALRDAVRAAAADAAIDGIRFEITSGWRSPGYQRWLFEEAVEAYGSEEVARRFVASPESSSHVTGDAVDVGPVDAQFWLIEHGARYGLCQTYANERWHFELATTPGGVCPDMLADASHG